MERMGMETNDEQGHLISRSLGGFQDYNIVPMATNINRHRTIGSHDEIVANTYVNPNQLSFRENRRFMQYPLSGWRSNEELIEGFINRGGNRRVEYFVTVQYSDTANERIQQRQIVHTSELRPTHFMQYFEFYENNQRVETYGPHTFLNDDSFQCADVQPSEDD